MSPCPGVLLQESQFCHQILDNCFLVFEEHGELIAGIVNIHPTVTRTHSFPFRRIVQLGNCGPIGIGLAIRQTRGRKKSSPVDESDIDALLFERRRVYERRHPRIISYRKKPHLA